MNTAQIKAYAPQARRDFIQAITDKANIYGLSAQTINPAEIKGDIAIIAGRAYPKKIGEMQQRLISRIKNDNFEQVMEAIAYTWFNRFMALRYMEIHDYLEHGYCILSNRGKSDIPEILEQAANINLPGLDKDKVVEYRLAGDKDNELYQMLILAQCHALHRTMPFLFEPIDNETELLIPDNLLYSNSPIRKMVNEIDESEWNNVEIIGWIYQFYISEKKAQVIGKVVKSEDIPAATQLFTPNWIVKYMVQNTLGRMWLATYPDSPLKNKMEYYIEPAEQEPEVQAELERITPKELNPEEITFLDPACGSGHILVEAYTLFKEIYLERGYCTRDIPKLILEKNIYGLDICDRAAQLACFAVVMKAREDDRRILGRDDLKLNVISIQESDASDINDIEIFFKDDETIREGLKEIVRLFENAKTFGSLITVPENLVGKTALFETAIQKNIKGIFRGGIVESLQGLLKQAEVLEKKYDCVVTNPPYMGSKFFNPELKSYINATFKEGKGDFYGGFILKNITLCKCSGFIGMITIPNWMFLSTFEELRNKLFENNFIDSFVHNGRGVWGSDFGSCSFIICNYRIDDYKGTFKRLFDKQGSVAPVDELEKRFFNKKEYLVSSLDLKKIPGSPIAYWLSERMRGIFERSKMISDIADVKHGLSTGKNEAVVRFWAEVSSSEFGPNFSSRDDAMNSGFKWFPYNKGGNFRKWYGNNEFVLRYDQYGNDLMSSFSGHRHDGKSHYFRECATWTFLSSSNFASRYSPQGFVFDVAGSSLFAEYPKRIVAFLCSNLCFEILKALNPTLAFQVGNIKTLPVKEKNFIAVADKIDSLAERTILLSNIDWDSYETSWDFTNLPLLHPDYRQPTLKATYHRLRIHWHTMTLEMQNLEEENNCIFIKAYGLQDEFTPDVTLSEITLTCNLYYRYGDNKTEEELESLLQTDTIKELISYAIGCMMGRYSLDEPGLIYAHSGNIDFDLSKYKTFPADDDGIIPIMDQDWFSDDATTRFCEFIKVAWPSDTLGENMKFIADSLSPKKHETPIDTIRRYLSAGFFKDHIKTYKKRPIYWLFSSGKQKAFECLIYLHRYNESTLARMRNAYVTPLQGKFNARIGYLQTEINATETLPAKKKFQKELEILKKKKSELAAFDDELRHYADMRISLDLDDGVKVNYGKFGELLAEKKAITGA